MADMQNIIHPSRISQARTSVVEISDKLILFPISRQYYINKIQPLVDRKGESYDTKLSTKQITRAYNYLPTLAHCLG